MSETYTLTRTTSKWRECGRQSCRLWVLLILNIWMQTVMTPWSSQGQATLDCTTCASICAKVSATDSRMCLRLQIKTWGTPSVLGSKDVSTGRFWSWRQLSKKQNWEKSSGKYLRCELLVFFDCIGVERDFLFTKSRKQRIKRRINNINWSRFKLKLPKQWLQNLL